MIGPLFVIVTPALIGLWTGGTAGLAGGALVGLAIVGAVAAGAVLWARQVGSMLEPEVAWAEAPRIPLLGAMCDRIYRKAFGKP